MPKFEYSLNDHYRWGWGEGSEWFNVLQPDHGLQRLSLGSCTRPHEGFRVECTKVAEHLGSLFSKPTLIGLSGGFDSQVACLSFMEAKVPFRPVILHLRSSDGTTYNQHDIDGAFEFCKKFNLDPLIEHLDLERFYKTYTPRLTRDYRLSNPRTMVQLYLIEKYGRSNSYIMGGGDMVLSPSMFMENETIVWAHGAVPIQQYLIDNEIEGVTKFFMYSPEQILSYLDNTTITNFINARVAIYDAYKRMKGVKWAGWWQCFSFFIKPMFYVEAWPELVQRRKFTGFEKVNLVKPATEMISVINNGLNIVVKKIIIPISEIIDHLKTGNGSEKIWTSNYVSLVEEHQRKIEERGMQEKEAFDQW